MILPEAAILAQDTAALTTRLAQLTETHPTLVQVREVKEILVVEKFRQPKAVAVTVVANMVVAVNVAVSILATTSRLVVDTQLAPTLVTVTVVPDWVVAVQVAEDILELAPILVQLTTLPLRLVTDIVVPEKVTAVVKEELIELIEAVAKVTLELVATACGMEIVVFARTVPDIVTAILLPIKLPVATTAGVIFVAVK